MAKKAVFYIFLFMLLGLNGFQWYRVLAGPFDGLNHLIGQVVVLLVFAGASLIVLVPMGQDAFKKDKDDPKC